MSFLVPSGASAPPEKRVGRFVGKVRAAFVAPRCTWFTRQNAAYATCGAPSHDGRRRGSKITCFRENRPGQGVTAIRQRMIGLAATHFKAARKRPDGTAGR